jgi:hypothetical protein
VSYLAQSPSIPWRRVGEDILLAPAGREEFAHLSGTAAQVWGLLATPCTLTELIDVLAEMYSAPVERISTDVQSLIADLIERGAVRRHETIHG